VRSGRDRRKQRVHATEPIILFTVAGCQFAVAARAVSEIQDTQAVRALRADAKGRGKSQNKVHATLRRKGQTYFIVSANELFRLGASKGTRILLVRNSPVALQVDAIDRMAELERIHALPSAFCGEERNWYRGLALINGRVVPVLNPQALLSHAEIESLRAGMRDEAREPELAGAAR